MRTVLIIKAPLAYSSLAEGASRFDLNQSRSAVSTAIWRTAAKRLPPMGDPFLNYFALFLLIFVVVVLFYGIIAIHDIPAKIAESRHHPHRDAIHAAGWVSLFTLHALWPFLWIWAMAYRPERGWGFPAQSPGAGAEPLPASASELEDLRRRVAELESSIKAGGE
jgi:glucan phosphoethanolaminetransferase (alkaline phosphatase superfamily)